jgi:hypothetical protein
LFELTPVKLTFRLSLLRVYVFWIPTTAEKTLSVYQWLCLLMQFY